MFPEGALGCRAGVFPFWGQHTTRALYLDLQMAGARKYLFSKKATWDVYDKRLHTESTDQDDDQTFNWDLICEMARIERFRERDLYEVDKLADYETASFTINDAIKSLELKHAKN